MKRSRKSLVLVLITFIMALSFQTTMYAAGNQDDEVVRTIEQLNELRRVYGVPVLSYNDILNKTATIHNRYMDFNETYSSIEESGKLYYRGRYPWDRATYAGYENSYVFETLIKDVSTYSNGLSYLLENPYSRYAILDPLYTDLGMNTYKGYTTYLFGGETRENFEVVYPYNGQSNVDTTFTNKYMLNPYTKITGEESSVGVPITYTIYSSEAEINVYEDIQVRLLNTRSNEEVKVKVLTSSNDRNLTSTIAILPLEAYDSGTTYEVSISGRIYFNDSINLGRSTYFTDINYEGTFTTEYSSNDTSSYSYVTRAEFVEELMKNSNYVIRDSLKIIFPDVNINAPNYKYIYTAYVNNIIKGYGDGYYRPDGNISREQAYTILIRNYENQYGKIELTGSERVLAFEDADDIKVYYIEAIYKAKKIGLLVENIYTFDPQEYITTSEFDYIMARYSNIIN